jgi:hypothetical protein
LAKLFNIASSSTRVGLILCPGKDAPVKVNHSFA